jgi:hypothetical protein
MSTQITLPAERRIPFGWGWLAAVLLAVSLGGAAATYLALRSDGAANPKPAVVTPAAGLPTPAGSITDPGSGQAGIADTQPTAVLPKAHHSAGFKRAAERPGWAGPGSAPGRGSDAGCTVIGGRQAC